MQRRHEEALELALEAVKQDPLGVRPRIAAALCLLDRGDWHQALSIYRELRESDVNDPRVKALSVILGHEADTEDIEVSLVLEKGIARGGPSGYDTEIFSFLVCKNHSVFPIADDLCGHWYWFRLNLRPNGGCSCCFDVVCFTIWATPIQSTTAQANPSP